MRGRICSSMYIFTQKNITNKITLDHTFLEKAMIHHTLIPRILYGLTIMRIRINRTISKEIYTCTFPVHPYIFKNTKMIKLNKKIR